MRVTRLIRFRMVNDGFPPRRSGRLERQGAENRKQVLNKERSLIRLVGVQPVIPRLMPNPPQPVENERHDERPPAKHEQRGDGARMQ
jgi:hypothetical protein